MILIKNIILLFVFAIILFGCPDAPENPPEPPRLVDKSFPDALVEAGIDVESQGVDQSILLMWHPNLETDISGYKVYRNADIKDSVYREIKDISGTNLDTSYFDKNVKERIDYHYYIKAYNTAKEKSEPSDTVRYTLGIQPQLISPDDEIVKTDKLLFKWFDTPYGYHHTGEYVIRMEEKISDIEYSIIWIARFTNLSLESGDVPHTKDYFDSTPPYPGPPDHVLSCYSKYSQLPSGDYRWKIKTIIELDNRTNLDFFGGESTWSYFTVDDSID